MPLLANICLDKKLPGRPTPTEIFRGEPVKKPSVLMRKAFIEIFNGCFKPVLSGAQFALVKSIPHLGHLPNLSATAPGCIEHT